jgi:predicted dehydrogenase
MDDPWPDNFWANDGQIGGGNVISQGVHGTDLLRFLAGAEPEFVFAAGGNYHQKAGVIDNLSATFTFENGASGNLVVGDTGQPPLLGKFCVQLFGPEGSIIIMERLTRLQFHARANSSTMLFTGVENGFMAENRALVQAVHGQIPVATSTWDGYMAQAMIDAAIRSLQSKSAESVS